MAHRKKDGKMFGKPKGNFLRSITDGKGEQFLRLPSYMER